MEYRTPGAYVEEISKLPPAIAQVNTAIPVFIGYTQMAQDRVADDLLGVAKRIVSPLEYEQHFGTAENEDSIAVTLTDNPDGTRSILAQAPTSPSPFLMRYAIQQYYANGGGPCYILSVGDYNGGPPNLGVLQDALEILKEEDEPTLIVYPDAINLPDAVSYYNLYESALAHCAQMQDRFALIDTFEGANWSNVVLRDELTSDTLNYGAAYFPHIVTSLNYQYDPVDVDIDHPTSGAGALEDVTEQGTIVNDAQSDAASPLFDINAANDAINVPPLSIPADNAAIFTNGQTVADNTADMIPLLQAAIQAADDARDIGDTAVAALDDTEDPGDTLRDAIQNARNAVDTADLAASLNTVTTELPALLSALEDANDANPANDDAAAGVIQAQVAAIAAALSSTDGDFTALDLLLDALNTGISNSVVAEDDTLEGLSLASLEASHNDLYHRIRTEIERLKVTLPPSPMIAGIIARTDDARGFWKAPANVAVSNIVGGVSKVTNDIQDDMNVDPTAGKSVNAIRHFTGKGTLVWGARTLQGNSREWRYVNVRRSFLVIEESIKKGTEAFVFEPNDRNTWSKVKSMIDSYLNNLWRQGALFGSKPEESFKTSIGLGETMTYNDVLDGKMIVRIEIALVRPAEFIILQFEHKMVEA